MKKTFRFCTKAIYSVYVKKYISEPNGNTYENCGEFLVDTLDDGWNDYDCTQPLPFICEKKGDNYVPPPGMFWT